MRYVLLLLVALLVLGIGGFVRFAWHGSIAPISPPTRASFDQAAIARGARLAALGDCISCHTVQGGTAFAGGRAVQTPFGAVYASNITPDPATGIGIWPEAAFRRAMHEGVDRAGRQLYPAFPYDHFTPVSEADDADLYAYLMTRDPAHATVPPNDLSFPFGIRSLLAGWKLLFFRPATFHPDSAQSAEWNRGAYLVQGLAPLRRLPHPPQLSRRGKVRPALRRAATRKAGTATRWTRRRPAPEPWTVDSLYEYLRHGWQARHGVALGPMGEVTQRPRRRDPTPTCTSSRPMSPRSSARRNRAPRRRRCRRRADRVRRSIAVPAPTATRAAAARRSPASSLALSSALHAPNPTNLATIVVGGIPATGEEPAPIMPGFGAVLTDRQMADLLTWLRARFGAPQPWDGIPEAVQAAATPPPCARQSNETQRQRPEPRHRDVHPDTPLLYVLREDLGLNAAKSRVRRRDVRTPPGEKRLSVRSCYQLSTAFRI